MTQPDRTTRAIILRSVDFKESDRILTLLTETLGRISVLARGARKSNRRFAGALATFAVFEAVLGHRRGELWPLKEATLLDAHPNLATDLKRVEAGSLVLELAREVTTEQLPDDRLFSLVVRVLSLIGDIELNKVDAVVIAGTLRILAQSGTAVSTIHCNACGKPVPADKKVYFNPARGGVVCTPCGKGPILLQAAAGRALAALSTLPVERTPEVELTEEIKVELKNALFRFWEHHLGRPPRAAFLS